MIRTRTTQNLWPMVVALWVCFAGPLTKAAPAQGDIGHAERLYARALYDSAQTVLDSLLASDSADATAWMLQSRIHAVGGDGLERLHALRRVQSAIPFYPGISSQLTEAFLDLNQTDSAETYLEKLPPRLRLSKPFPLYLQGWLLEAQGRHDSAVDMYRQAFRAVQAQSLVNLPVGGGTRLSAITLFSYGRRPAHFFPGRPTVFLFWGTGLTVSETAMNALAVQSPRAGIDWRFVPIHVDAGDAPAVDPLQRARELEYDDTVWVDSGLRLFHRWGLTRIPTVIFTGIDGEIDQVLQDWSDTTRDAIFETRFGNFTDTVLIPAEPPDLAVLRPARALARAQTTWNGGHRRVAIRSLSESLLKHPSHLLSHVQLADWRWQQGDTLGARMAAHKALALDSLDAWALLIVAEIERRHQNYTKAIDLLQKCVSIDPRFVRGWISLGIEAALSGDTARASEALHHLQKLDSFDRWMPVLTAGLTDGAPELRAASWRRAIRPLLR